MKVFYAILFALSLSLSNAYERDLGCAVYHDGNCYNFRELQQSQQECTLSEDINEKEGKVHYRFCDSFQMGASNHKAFAFLKYYPKEETEMETEIETEALTKSGWNSDSKYEFHDKYLYIKFDKVAQCPDDNNKTVQFSYNMTCNKKYDDADKPQVTGTYNKSDCQIMLKVESKYSCYLFSLNSLWEFIQEYYYIMGVILILLGLYLCFFGLKTFKVTLFIFATLIMCVVLLFIFYQWVVPPSAAIWIGWFILGGAIVVGLAFGWLSTKFARVGVFALGALGGAVLGMILYDAFMFMAPTYVLWIVVGVLAAVAGILSFFAYEHMVIISTALFGGYAFIRGISLFAGHYPNEFTIYDEIKHGIMKQPWQYYVYLVAILIMITLGIIWQERAKKNETDDEAEKRADYVKLYDRYDARSRGGQYV